ncbi:hypothetical protein mRhiFer1_017058 [Rhinolophus ferrumequinum]|uniref:Uncharacterized protein n=1 Tax=Rhinolophus ferrumequinum TaxID=59479 RepID=A0A7J7SLN0_RHIFE|nr:hypothetical protein mRhiFer1_017058 [Rhinolophus ferrumequinum]
MGFGMRGGLDVFMVGALLVLALLKAMVKTQWDLQAEILPHISKSPLLNPQRILHMVPFSHPSESSKSTVKPSITPVSSVTVTTSKPTAKPSTTPVSSVSKSVPVTTLKPIATSKITPPEVSTNMTSTTLKSTPKITSVSQNTAQMST